MLKTEGSQKGIRLVGLDFLRIVSAFVVFLFHSHIHIGCQYGIFTSFINMGAIFMTAFFMLSGFTLFHTHSQKSLTHISVIKSFYIKRLITIFPLYYVVALLYILFLGTETLKQNLLLAPIEILGLQSVFTSIFNFSHNGGTWFISCIAICYLLYPYLQEMIKQMRQRTKWLLIGFSVFVLLWSPIIQLGFKTGSIYANPFFRMLEFLIGMLLCSVYQSCKTHKIVRIVGSWPVAIISAIALVAGVTVVSKTSIPHDYMLYNWIGLPLFMILLFSLVCIPFQNKARPVTAYLCNISYAFFFAQFFVWKLVKKIMQYLGTDSNIIKILFSLLLCLIFTIVLHELAEKPLKKWLTKLLLHKRECTKCN